jgi:outer membrane protein assembly factor BamB
MFNRLLLCGLAVLASQYATPSYAQVFSSLVSNVEADRFGLERVWFTRMQFDRGRGRVAYIRQHVSSKYGYRVYEIESERGRTVITDRDVDRLGVELGRAGAERKANKLVQQYKQAGLKAEMKTRVLPEITIYGVSNTGVVEAIDAETGRTRWTTTVGKRDYPVEAPGANDDYVAVLNGSSLYLLDQATGAIVWRRITRGAPGAGTAISDNYVFVPMIGGTIEGYDIQDGHRPPWIYQGHGRALIQPVIAGTNVAWPTDAGHLYVAEANRTGIKYRIEATKTIVARATALPPDRLITLSTDGYVYCLHASSGGLQWQFSTGEPLMKPAVVIGDAVFVVTDNDNLYRLSAATGQEVWWAPRVREVITASENRLYCIGDTGRMIIFDANSGGRLGMLSTEILDLKLVNYQTDRIFIGSTSGVIQCLREVQSEWPLIRAGGFEEDPDAKAKEAPTEPPEDAMEAETPEEPATADPFGAESSDPFGTGSDSSSDSTDDPFGTGSDSSSDTSDPFGTGF